MVNLIVFGYGSNFGEPPVTCPCSIRRFSGVGLWDARPDTELSAATDSNAVQEGSLHTLLVCG